MSSMPLYVSVPERGGPFQVLWLYTDNREDFIKATTHIFAVQGYAAAMEFFSRQLVGETAQGAAR